jgi:hypothetical protein
MNEVGCDVEKARWIYVMFFSPRFLLQSSEVDCDAFLSFPPYFFTKIVGVDEREVVVAG